MTNLKKYTVFLQYFVLFLTFTTFFSCSQQKYAVTKIEGTKIAIDKTASDVATIETYIKPYRERIDSDLNSVLAYNPETLDKSKGEWQTAIGNLLSDVTLAKGNVVFKQRENKIITICLLNNGGIRSVLSKGNVTTRTAFEIMPFENSLMVIGLKGEQILEIPAYIIKEKKPHPLSGLTFSIDKNNQAKNILVQGQPVDRNTIYYVATSDYLASGGDNMKFFEKGVSSFDLNYKLRNILIDYFKDVDTIPSIKDIRIIKE